MTSTVDESVSAFAAAADFLVVVVDRVTDSDWERPGLGSWNVRELVAHASRGMTTVEQYLIEPVDPATVPKDYATPEAIEARARAAVAALGDDPSATVRQTRDRVVPLIARTPMDAVVGSPFGRTTLGRVPARRVPRSSRSTASTSPTRSGSTVEPPSDALAETLRHVANVAVGSGHGRELLRALSGRDVLPPGFSVY